MKQEVEDVENVEPAVESFSFFGKLMGRHEFKLKRPTQPSSSIPRVVPGSTSTLR